MGDGTSFALTENIRCLRLFSRWSLRQTAAGHSSIRRKSPDNPGGNQLVDGNRDLPEAGRCLHLAVLSVCEKAVRSQRKLDLIGPSLTALSSRYNPIESQCDTRPLVVKTQPVILYPHQITITHASHDSDFQ